MTYTVQTLITNAYYLSEIVARDMQTVSGDQINNGLNLLNELLAVKSFDSGLIPYFSQYTTTAVPGQEMYFIPNLVEIETFTFNINTVRFSSQRKSREAYFGEPRVDNVNSLPFSWHTERALGGTNLYLYFLPQQNFPLTIWGKFGLTQATSLTQDLSIVYDLFYIAYLRYALADYLCSDYGIEFPMKKARQLEEFEKQLFQLDPVDMTMQKVSSFTERGGLTWANVNFPGWVP